MTTRRFPAAALVTAVLSGAVVAPTPARGAAIDPSRVVDLTLTLGSSTPYWPGPGYRPFATEVIATIEKNGVYSKSYCTPEHLGTHVDAPNHFEPGQIPLDEIALADLMAPAIVIDITAKTVKDPDALLTIEDIRSWERAHGQVPAGVIVLLRTGWGSRAADAAAYRNADSSGRLRFPSYSPESAEYLVGPRKARALGIDTLSIDAGVSTDFRVHHIVNSAGRYGIENLSRLETLPATGVFLIVAPARIDGATGGQARVFALLP